MSGMAGHEPADHRGGTNEWLTPPAILDALRPFDLDPCAPVNRPWDTAEHHYTIEDDGLSLPWEGRVWLNPPYGNETGKWLARLADHGNGIALIYARTETKTFFDHVWSRADALLFLEGRLTFHRPDGSIGPNPGAASVLVAYGAANVWALSESNLPGAIVFGWNRPRRPASLFDLQTGVNHA